MEQRDDLWHCGHEETAIRRRVKSNDVSALGHQCLACGAWVREVPKGGPEASRLAHIDPYDAELPERWARQRKQVWEGRQETYQAQRQREANEWRIKYLDYLDTPQWAARRDLVLKRSRGVCEGCGTRRATQVHHLTYQHLGNEFLFELVALCRPCHERWHGVVGVTVRLTSRAGGAG